MLTSKIFFRYAMFAIIGFVVIGCSSGDDSDDTDTGGSNYAGSLESNYTADNVTFDFHSCFNSMNNRTVILNRGTFTLTGGNDSAYTATAEFSDTTGFDSTTISMTMTGSVNNMSMNSGPLDSIVSENGSQISSGTGAHSGSTTTYFLTVAFSWTDIDSDGCTGQGTVDFVADNAPQSGSFGSLSISGADVANTGTEFIPDSGTLDSSYAWEYIRPTIGTLMSLHKDINGIPTRLRITFFDASISYNVTYMNDCTSVDCSGISIDSAAKTVTFSNVSVEYSVGTGTAPIVINGTLLFTEI